MVADGDLVIGGNLEAVKDFGAELVAEVVVGGATPHAANRDNIGWGDELSFPADTGGNHVLDAVDVSFTGAVSEEGDDVFSDVLVDAEVDTGVVGVAVVVTGVAVPGGETIGAFSGAFDFGGQAESKAPKRLKSSKKVSKPVVVFLPWAS